MPTLPITTEAPDGASESADASFGGSFGGDTPTSGGDTLGAPALGDDSGGSGHNPVGPADASPVDEERKAPKLGSLIGYGHSVTRWHTLPCLHRQTIAEHSWAVAKLVSRLYPGPAKDRLALIEAALDHDLVEAIIGDMPRPGRTEDHRRLEERTSIEMGLRNIPKKLQPWLEWADLIEAGLYTLREMKLGNQNFVEVSLRVADYLQRSEREIPRELWDFAKEEGLL